MVIIKVVLDEELLKVTDVAAGRAKRSRSEFVRDALGEYLQKLDVLSLEARDRRGYARQPQVKKEMNIWEAEAVWPAR